MRKATVKVMNSNARPRTQEEGRIAELMREVLGGTGRGS